MLVNKWLQVIFLITFLSSSSLLANDNEERIVNEAQEIDDDAPNPYHKYVQEIISTFSDKMLIDLGLNLSGAGGSMHEKIKKISFSFRIYRKANLDEARAIHLYAVNKLAEIINSHKKIQPFLVEKPFSYRNIEIEVSYEGINGLPSDGTMAYVYNVGEYALPESKNSIVYKLTENYIDHSITKLREPYEEAIIKAKKAALVFPYTHELLPFESAIDDIVSHFSSKVWLKRGIECRHISVNTPNKVGEISAELYCFHRANQDQAREVVVYLVETLLAMFNENEAIRPYLVTYPLTSKSIRFQLDFKNYKYTPFPEGVASVILNDNELAYTHRVPTTIETVPGETLIATLPLGKESYSEAFKIVQETPISIFQKIQNMLETGYRWVFNPNRPL